jgi:hypothetical protein
MSNSPLQHLIKYVTIVVTAFAVLAGCQENTEEALKTVALKPPAIDKRVFNKPTQAVILEVTGKISQFNDQKKLLLDREQLLSFKQVEVKTATPWTDKLTRFKGPLLRDVLAASGSTGDFIYAKAVNEYAVKIPINDAQMYSVILAIEQDDQELTIRNKGPIWLIYPWSGSADLKQDKVYSRSIWHLISMRIHD